MTIQELADKNNFNLERALDNGYSTQSITAFLETKEVNQDKYLELLLVPPKYLSADIKNNIWMKNKNGEDKEVIVDKAMAEFFQMYALFSQDALTYLLPPKAGLQDQNYISNAGCVLPHLPKTVILANFEAEGRPGEEVELAKFMTLMGYQQFRPPFYFEGEADLKWIRDNIYCGGYGMRTEIQTLNWLENKFDCKIIKIKKTDPKRYHLDCLIFPVSREKVFFAEDQVEGDTLKELEKIVECIPINKRDSQFSLTNGVRIGSIIYNSTGISEMDKNDPEYESEKAKNEKLEKICEEAGLSLVMLNLAEINKSGAALSCCVMHLSYIGYPD